MTFSDWDWNLVEAMVNTNYKGAIYTTHACISIMAKQKTNVIVGVSSGAAMGGLGGRAIYSSTKAALAVYLESMAADLSHIQFTTIYPGFVETPMSITMFGCLKIDNILTSLVISKSRSSVMTGSKMILIATSVPLQIPF
jgi:NAD(P)-dependent dehydrogenase (short-subunit alcohol dehydrogenase family)